MKTRARIQSEDTRPAPQFIFRPFIETPLNKVKVVIIGQEPSCLVNTPDGLAYSTSDPFVSEDHLPRQLAIIASEVSADVDKGPPKAAHLRNWARQGVLLLNSSLTVRFNMPYSHMGLWDDLICDVIDAVYEENPNAVFCFWNWKGQDFSGLLPDGAQVIKTPGPYPGSAMQFYGTRPFSKINKMLDKTGQNVIHWDIK